MYNTEYFYGDGIATGYPANTPYGKPIRQDDKGQTTKTLQEIQAWITQQAQEFSYATYNPMTHNCNHFSNAFLQFLNGEKLADEILEQPQEFLSTPLGKMVGSMLGFAQAPAEYKKEEVNQDYVSLYIEEPKVFKADEGQLIQFIVDCKGSGKFTDQMNRILAAANEKKDFVADKQVMEELTGFKVNDQLFELLALIAMTSSVDNIPAQLRPYAFIEGQMGKTTEAFFRYLNNWFSETVGMRDAREHAVEYSAFIRQFMEDEAIALMASRCYYTFSRTQTYNNIKVTTPIPYLIQMIQNCGNKRKTQAKPWTACLNLLCGCIGRILLTIKPRDAGAYNTMKLKIQTEINFETMADINAPCIKDITKLIGKKEEKKEDDGFF